MVDGRKMDQAEFKGYVTAKLEEIHSDLGDVKKFNSRVDSRVCKIENRCAAEKVEIETMKKQFSQEAASQGGKSGALIGGLTIIVAGVAYAIGKFFGWI